MWMVLYRQLMECVTMADRGLKNPGPDLSCAHLLVPNRRTGLCVLLACHSQLHPAGWLQVEEYPEEEDEIPSDTDERLLDDAPAQPVLLLDNRPHSPGDSQDMDQALQHDELRAFAKVRAMKVQSETHAYLIGFTPLSWCL